MQIVAFVYFFSIKFIDFKQIRNYLSTSSVSSQKNVVNLSYDSNDKFNSKSALVIAHGLFASKSTWRAMARRINEATKQRVYTVDMRNHGNTAPYVDSMTYADMAGDLENFINKVVVEKDKCERVTIMGHSMGGKATMTLVLGEVKGFEKKNF
jgi:abhydrolase domain-containing protein 11